MSSFTLFEKYKKEIKMLYAAVVIKGEGYNTVFTLSIFTSPQALG